MALCRKYGFSGTKTLNQIKPTLYTFGKHHIPLVMFYIILYFWIPTLYHAVVTQMCAAEEYKTVKPTQAPF